MGPNTWVNRDRISSCQFSCSVVSDSLWPHESQHARPPCPSTTPRVHSNSCLSSRWCHPAISSSVVPFSNSILLLLFIHLLNKGMRQKQGWLMNKLFSSVQFSSVAQSCPVLCDPIDRSTPGLPVHHQLPEPTQTYVHWGSDAIQTSHSLSSPSPPAFNLSQHQSLFQWVSASRQVAKVLELQFQHQSF